MDYIQAHKTASHMQEAGEIISFMCTHDQDNGRQIFVESDQGWNPYPLYIEFPHDPVPEVPN